MKLTLQTVVYIKKIAVPTFFKSEGMRHEVTVVRLGNEANAARCFTSTWLGRGSLEGFCFMCANNGALVSILALFDPGLWWHENSEV